MFLTLNAEVKKNSQRKIRDALNPGKNKPTGCKRNCPIDLADIWVLFVIYLSYGSLPEWAEQHLEEEDV